MAQQRNGRRGAVFSVRLTDEQRAKLERLQRAGGGPRRLGPWLVWSALEEGRPAHVRVVPVRSPDRYYPSSRRVILDLCAGSGAWGEPYRAAGYDVRRVTLPGEDVRTFRPDGPVWGVLAAPPCDQFSLARNGHKTPRDFLGGMACVNACMRIVQQSRPRWWALENPVGLLSRFLGTPRDVFEPCDFGDPWTKRTALWGEFDIPARGPFVEPRGGGPLCRVCDPTRRKTTWCGKREHRAITPAGFAHAFFEANP